MPDLIYSNDHKQQLSMAYMTEAKIVNVIWSA